MHQRDDGAFTVGDDGKAFHGLCFIVPNDRRAGCDGNHRMSRFSLTEMAAAGKNLERETGFEPATSTLARSHSTTELLPLGCLIIANARKARQTRRRLGGNRFAPVCLTGSAT